MSDVITLDLDEVAGEWADAIDTLDPEMTAADGEPIYTEDEKDEAREIIERCEQLCRDLGYEPVEPESLKHAGVTLIREDTFEDYCREFAEDIHGDGVREMMAYIDWGRYADACRSDYYELEYDGHEWLRRA